MKIFYFEDVDVLEFVFRSEVAPVAETVDGPKDEVLMDYDQQGRLVGMTVHAASENMDLDDLRGSVHFETKGTEVQVAS